MKKAREVEIDRFEEALEIVRSTFPTLRIDVARGDHHAIDASATLPAQTGLAFRVGFNLQFDALHLNASHFWVEWFPCGKQRVFDQFVEAVTGLLSGKYRLLESYVFGKCVASRLQRPVGDGGWKTVARLSAIEALVPWPRSHRVVRNA